MTTTRRFGAFCPILEGIPRLALGNAGVAHAPLPNYRHCVRMQGFIAIFGSIAILVWPVLVMVVRAVVQQQRTGVKREARQWMSDWFAGPGIIITGAWIVGIFGIRIITDALLADQESVGVISWVLVGAAMLVMVPIATRRAKPQSP